MIKAPIILDSYRGSVPESPKTIGLNFQKWRPYQRETVDYIVNSPKKVVMLDAPTGTGKSLIGAALCRFYFSSIYACTTKDLQEQLQNDFPDFPIIRGRNNYPCCYSRGIKNLFPRITSEDCNKRYIKDSYDPMRDVSCRDRCEYLIQKKFVIHSQICIANVSYLLHEINYIGAMSGRQLAIIDEADKLEQELMAFVEISISEKFIQKMDIELPVFKTKPESWIEWAIKTEPLVHSRLIEAESSIRGEGSAEIEKMSLIKKLKSLLSKITFLILNETSILEGQWVFVERNSQWSIKPVWVRNYAKQYLFNHFSKIVLMSGTILSPQNIAYIFNLDRSEWDYISIPCQFSPERRTTYYYPTANLTVKTRNEIENVIPVISKILDLRKEKKGLIHTVSYENAKYIMDKLNSPRLLIHDSYNRSKIISRFKKSNYPIVILSPSMDRGIDLKYDLCSFIIILKVPYPDLSDKQIAARLYGGKGYGQAWYAWMTACTIVQMSGRATRAHDDFSETFILDKQFMMFYEKYHKLFPQWWKEALTFLDDISLIEESRN